MDQRDVASSCAWRRWLIVGHSGAGKSTLAAELSAVLGLPLVHLDRLSWLPGWIEEDRRRFASKVVEATAGDEWIIDGNYAGSLPLRLARAQAAVWLDYSLPRCLLGLGRRIARWRGEVRPDMADGCPERIDWSFVQWVITHHGRSRRLVSQALCGEGAHVRLLRFTNPLQTRSFLQALRPAVPIAHPVPAASCR